MQAGPVGIDQLVFGTLAGVGREDELVVARPPDWIADFAAGVERRRGSVRDVHDRGLFPATGYSAETTIRSPSGAHSTHTADAGTNWRRFEPSAFANHCSCWPPNVRRKRNCRPSRENHGAMSFVDPAISVVALRFRDRLRRCRRWSTRQRRRCGPGRREPAARLLRAGVQREARGDATDEEENEERPQRGRSKDRGT